MFGFKTIKTTRVGPTYGKLPKGCNLCGKGSKLVLFATGLCDFNCFYCPISKVRKGADTAFANERPIGNVDDLLDEAHQMRALGAGVTGGDPLKSKQTFEFIKTLKENFNQNFHIHLYTKTTTPKFLKLAYDAGVDEIRFHWSDPTPALDFDWEVGAEVPAIPGEFQKLCDYLGSLNSLGVKFVNLNELEFSDSNFETLRSHDLEHIDSDDESIGVKGSEPLAKKMVEWAKDQGMSTSVHYCSAQTKLFTQLVSRYKRTAKNIAQSFETVTREGTILVGEVPNTPENKDKLKQFEEYGEWLRTNLKNAEKLGGRVVEYWPTFDKRIIEITNL
ncbi:MAG: radical SAM protein [Candidatus Altiarchaeota archaeon]|nr:radical SAM protein [Candidatus Altiarchaeota archaeon]